MKQDVIQHSRGMVSLDTDAAVSDDALPRIREAGLFHRLTEQIGSREANAILSGNVDVAVGRAATNVGGEDYRDGEGGDRKPAAERDKDD